jgi:uncharacterized membrane protein
MAKDSRTFEVDRPIHEVYQRWLDYEGLVGLVPQIKEVRKTGENHSHWVVEALGVRVEWDAEVTAKEENRRIAWRSISGFENRGEVLFEPIGGEQTRVTVHVEYFPIDPAEQGALTRQVDAATEVAQEILESERSIAWQ